MDIFSHKPFFFYLFNSFSFLFLISFHYTLFSIILLFLIYLGVYILPSYKISSSKFNSYLHLGITLDTFSSFLTLFLMLSFLFRNFYEVSLPWGFFYFWVSSHLYLIILIGCTSKVKSSFISSGTCGNTWMGSISTFRSNIH
jgi:hypothetical protein